MKKISAIILSILMLLSAFPAYAESPRTEVTFANYNNINEKFLITIKTADDTFEGANILIDNTVSYDLEENGAGSYTAAIDVSSLERACQVPVKVTASYGSEEDVIEKTAYFTKVVTTLKTYNYEDSDIRKSDDLSAGESNTCRLVDENGVSDATGRTFTIAFTRKCTDDIRVGYVGNGMGSGSLYTLEFEAHFRNGDSLEKEKPAAYYGIAFRQPTADFKDGYAYNSQTNVAAAEAGTTLIFKDNGTLTGTGEPYYTNTWYKVKCVMDLVTKDGGGNLVGGMQMYIAEKDGDEYGEFRLLKNHEYFTLKSVSQWRFYPRSNAAGGTMTIRNMNVTMENPENTWYIKNSFCENGKINLEFSEDLGTVSKGDIKVFNNIYEDENGDIIPDEIAINSIEALGEGKYAVTPSGVLMSGRKYSISFKNGMVSAAGRKAFKEPAADENGDGFWNVASVNTPKASLSVKSVAKGSSAVEVTFNNTGEISGYASVCWYDGNGNMVDALMSPVTVADGEKQVFARNNSESAEKVKVFVFALGGEGENRGAIKVYDFQ